MKTPKKKKSPCESLNTLGELLVSGWDGVSELRANRRYAQKLLRTTRRVTGTHSFSPMIWLFRVETVAWISSGGVWNGSFFCPSSSKWNAARIICNRIQPRGACSEPPPCIRRRTQCFNILHRARFNFSCSANFSYAPWKNLNGTIQPFEGTLFKNLFKKKKNCLSPLP